MKIKHKKYEKVTVLHKGVSYLIHGELEVENKVGQELLKSNKSLMEIKETEIPGEEPKPGED